MQRRYIALIIADSGISIHAAREGGDGYGNLESYNARISIHAAREGGDEVYGELYYPDPISIHAAREGGDVLRPESAIQYPDFNPRRP